MNGINIIKWRTIRINRCANLWTDIETQKSDEDLYIRVIWICSFHKQSIHDIIVDQYNYLYKCSTVVVRHNRHSAIGCEFGLDYFIVYKLLITMISGQ